jgi:hypothetical protein
VKFDARENCLVDQKGGRYQMSVSQLPGNVEVFVNDNVVENGRVIGDKHVASVSDAPQKRVSRPANNNVKRPWSVEKGPYSPGYGIFTETNYIVSDLLPSSSGCLVTIISRNGSISVIQDDYTNHVGFHVNGETIATAK